MSTKTHTQPKPAESEANGSQEAAKLNTNRKKSHLRTAVAGVALVAAGAGIGAKVTSSGGDSNEASDTARQPAAASSNQLTSPTLPAPELSPRNHEIQAAEYLMNEDRNARIASVVDRVGHQVLEAADSGELGTFQFRNVPTTQDELYAAIESPIYDQPGLGWLEYDNGDHYAGVLIYRNDDGSYDLDRGILGLRVKGDAIESETSDMPYMLEFESPDTTEYRISGDTPKSGWSAVAVIDLVGREMRIGSTDGVGYPLGDEKAYITRADFEQTDDLYINDILPQYLEDLDLN